MKHSKVTSGEWFVLVMINILNMIFIIPIWEGYYTVQPSQAIVISFFGKVVKVDMTPGLRWYFFKFRKVHKVSLGNQIFRFL